MANFQDILNKPASAIEPPKPIPPGTYLGIVDGQPEFAKIGKNQTDCVNFKVKLVQAQEDVSQDDLQTALTRADGVAKSLGDIKLTVRQFLTEDSVWRLKQFLVDHLGIEDDGKSLGQMIPETMGKQVLLTIGHRPSEDGTQVFTDVKGTAKV